MKSKYPVQCLCGEQIGRVVRRWLSILTAFGLIIAACVTPAMAEPDSTAPSPGAVFWHPDQTHCRFVRTGDALPDPEKPETWRYLMVTELVSDDITSVERGYMRLDGLLRELDFVERKQSKAGETRTYRTFGLNPIIARIEMQAGDKEKSKIGQTVLVYYTGTITLIRGGSKLFVNFKGRCGGQPK